MDVCNWVLQSHPIKATATGGRRVRTDAGDNWDHYVVTYHYPDDVHVSFNSTQFIKGWWDACERFFGSKGISESHYVYGVRIHGEEPWDAGVDDALKLADAEKERAFIESILSGRFHNEAAQGAESTLSAILGRMAAYTRKEVSWDEVLRSEEAWEIDITQFGVKR